MYRSQYNPVCVFLHHFFLFSLSLFPLCFYTNIPISWYMGMQNLSVFIMPQVQFMYSGNYTVFYWNSRKRWNQWHNLTPLRGINNLLLHHCMFSTASRLFSTISLSNIIFWHHFPLNRKSKSEGIKHDCLFSQT